MEVILKNIRHGKDERKHIIYADVYSREGLEIAATLNYCLNAIETRGWELVPVFKKDH